MDERINMTDGAETLGFPVSAAAAMEALGWKRTDKEPAGKPAVKRTQAEPTPTLEGVPTNRSKSKK